MPRASRRGTSTSRIRPEPRSPRITKTWAGWAKERFTKADNYVVQMHRPLEEPLRSLVIAAALALDVELKQGDPTSSARRHRRGYR